MTDNEDRDRLKYVPVPNNNDSSKIVEPAEYLEDTKYSDDSNFFDDFKNDDLSKELDGSEIFEINGNSIVSENSYEKEEQIEKNDFMEEEPERPNEVVSNDGERAFFSGNTIQFVLPKTPVNSFSGNDQSLKNNNSFASNFIQTDFPDSDDSMKLVFSDYEAPEPPVNENLDSIDEDNSFIIPFSSDFPSTDSSDGVFKFVPEAPLKNYIKKSTENNRNDYDDTTLKKKTENCSTDESTETLTNESKDTAKDLPEKTVSEQNEESSVENFDGISKENANEEPENSSGFFSDFFEQSGGSGDELTKNFENALHHIFQTEENTDGSEENSEHSESTEQKDTEEDYSKSVETDLSDSERWQREEEEVQRENLDAIIRQNDADSLFELGEKYQKNISDLISIEEPKNTEVRPESILEAMLFVGDRQNIPLDLNKAVALMRNVSVEEAVQAIDNLNRRYKRLGAPYSITQKENGYVMELRPEFYAVRDHFFGKVREFKLSQKTIDLLALIAYRQPISLHEISDYNSGCASILSTLLKRDLITVEKKSVEKKMISFYRTTDRFLKVFNLDSLDDLPIVEEINYR